MSGILLSGPAGAGKSQRARELYAETPEPAVIVDFQEIYAALLMLRRNPETGRYPEREAIDDHIMPVAEYVRRAAITAAIGAGLFVIATNSDGRESRRSELIQSLGPGGREIVIDPGRDVVEERLAVQRILSHQCRDAIGRWYDVED